MGFFSEIKKLFFAQKSVAKSAANKAKAEGEEWVDSAKEKGSELYEKGKAKAEIYKDKIGDKLEQLEDKAEDKLDKLMDAFEVEDDEKSAPASNESPVEETKETQENVEKAPFTPSPPERSIPRDKTFVEKLGEKTLEKAEDIGEKTLEGMDKVGDKLGDIAEDVGKKTLEAKDSLVEKAKEVAADLDKKLDETVVKAKKLEEEMSANDKDKDGFADTGIDLGKSTLEGQDDFFSKAERFAKGEPLDDRPDMEIKQGEPQPKKDIKAAGFEDLDGDGDEIIDDAIIEDE